MKKNYPITFILLSSFTISFSQNSYHLDINNVDANVTPSSVLFYDSNDPVGFSCPKSLINYSTIYASSLWMGGADADGAFHLAANLDAISGTDFTPGPLPVVSQDAMSFNKVFPITKTEVDSFVAYTNCIADPNCDVVADFLGYVVPQNITNWPAHGDVSQGQNFQLAPFVDVDNDGFYKPENGDYPCFKGDEAAFYVLNDVAGLHPSGGEAIGTEVQIMVYAFYADPNSALNNTVFANYTIINKGSSSYPDFRLGMFADMDIGNGGNDFIGTYVTENTIFGCNGDVNEISDDNGLLTPAQGITFLNQNLTNSIAFGNSSSTHSYASNPGTSIDYYNYLRSVWKDGSHLTYGGNGHGGVYSANFIYPQNVSGSMLPWTEVTEGNTASERKILGATSYANFNPGDRIEVDFAFVWSRSPLNTAAASVDKLQLNVQEVQQFYDSQISSCYTSGGVVSVNEDINSIDLEVYPTQTNNWVQFLLKEPTSHTIRIYNLIGDLVETIESNDQRVEVDMSSFSSGLYIYSVEMDKGAASGKIIKY